MDLEVAAQHSQWLKALQEEIQQSRAATARICDGSRPPTEPEIQQIFALYQHQYDSFLMRYGQQATKFEQQGFPLLAQTLKAELADIQEAMRIFNQIAADRKKHEAQRWALQRETEDYVTRVQQEAYQNRQRVFDESNRRWHAAFMGQPTQPMFCPYCGRPLGFSGACAFCVR